MRLRCLATVVVLAIVATACTGDTAPQPDGSGASTTAAGPSEATVTTPAGTITPTPTPSTTVSPSSTTSATPQTGPATALTDQQLAELAVNEVGRVLVSEWHTIGADSDGDYRNTLATFREQLQYLYDRDLRPVTTAEYANGSFPIPAGTSPVILTFDDSSPNHFQWAEDGVTPEPDSVVGILEEFAASHDDWRATAMFAYNWPPFGDSDMADVQAKLQYLVDNGFELSNHTVTHANLSDLDDAGVQQEIGANVSNLLEVIPEAQVTTLTLPFGVHPNNESLMLDGTAPDGTSYHNDLVFEVGWMPDNSPHHVDYDPASIMRVPGHGPWAADDLDWWDWVDWLDAEPHRKFISDGDPTTVTYPADFESVAAIAEDVSTRTYAAVPAATETPE